MIRRLRDQAPSAEAPFSLGALIGFRLVIVTVLLFVAGYLEAVQEGTLPGPVFVLISATFALNVVYAILLALAPYRVQATVQILGDLVVVTGFVYLTGVDSTGFVILYPISVLCGSVLLGRGHTFALIANLLFAGAIGLARLGWIPPQGLQGIATGTIRNLVTPIVGMLLLSFSVSALGQFLARSLVHAGESLDEAVGQVASLQDLNRLIVENIQSGLVLVDRYDRITFINEIGAEILGVSSEMLLRMTAQEAFKSQQVSRQSLAPLATTARETRLELDYVCPSGQPRVLGFSISELASQGESRLFSFRDLTEVRRLEHEARLNEKLAAVGGMAAQLAHEIRNPLGAITAATKLMAEKPGAIQDQADLLRIVASESDRLAGTVTSFLRGVRVDSSERVECDVSAVIQDAVRLLEVSPERQPHHSIVLETPSTPLRARISAPELTQVFWNLSRNALEAMPDFGTLTIRMTREGDTAIVRFIDQGTGVDGARLRSLFEPLQTTKALGTGLGLAIAHRIVRHRGGDLTVVSEAGKGTEARITLPTGAVDAS